MSEAAYAITLRRGVSEPERAALMAAMRAAALERDAAHALVEATAPGGREAGDLIARFSLGEVGTQPAAGDLGLARDTAAMIALLDGAVFRARRQGGDSPRAGVYRLALFMARRDPTPARLAAFEAETAAMPRHVGAIRGWTLGAVTAACGRHAWTHVWEQTYDDLRGLQGPYMMHPCHWGQVDRWFDPEDPDWLVDLGLVHAFCEADDLPALGEGEWHGRVA